MMTPSEHNSHVGLIGGLAPRAGIFYYEQLQNRNALQGTVLDLTLRHADVATVLGHVSNLDRPALGRYLGGLANQLFDAGAGIVAVSAIAPHMAIREIIAEAEGTIVNLLDAIPGTLEATGYERVAVFGNRAVMDTDIYGSMAQDSVVHLEPAAMQAVHDTYNDIALTGKRHTPAEVEQLARIADQAMALGAQAIVLAGTDLSSFYSEQPPAFPHIDLAHTHIDQIMRSSGNASAAEVADPQGNPLEQRS